MDTRSPEELESILRRYPDLNHLRVRKRGQSLTLYSEDAHGPQDHARFTSLAARTWGLSLPHHTGRWEKTPFTGSLDELVEVLVTDFGFYLERYP
jgi:hypothetical protein